jgi:hypothetical protein
MYRASLASLSDSASLISEEDEEEDEDTETETEADAQTRRGEEGVREGELVDVR